MQGVSIPDLYERYYGERSEFRLRQHDTPATRRLGYYPYIPYDSHRFCHYMTAARNSMARPPQHFVDIGCGIGDKLMLMHEVIKGIPNLTGIEYNLSTARKAREVLKDKAKIIRKDAFKLTYEGYDLLYMYCPIMNVNKMADLYTHIASTMHVGAWLVEVYPAYAFFLCESPSFIDSPVKTSRHYALICEKMPNGAIRRVADDRVKVPREW